MHLTVPCSSPRRGSLLGLFAFACLVGTGLAHAVTVQDSTAHALQKSSAPFVTLTEDNPQLSAFVRRIFQDSRGHLWFGTNGDGVFRHDGKELRQFSLTEGFGGVAVRGIVEDRKGNVWFGTERGLTRYDGTSFVNFTTKDGLAHDDVWSLIVDRKGTLWIGTFGGVSRYDGTAFSPFPLPASAIDPDRGVSSPHLVGCIMEDSKGRMWFATAGGVHVVDGSSLRTITSRDGLCHDSVNCVLEAGDGSIWFATHHNGVCRYDGTSFTHFGAAHGVEGTEAWSLYKDRAGRIWFPIENSGVYRYDGTSFTNFGVAQGLTSNAIQCTFEDAQGRLWLGGWMGLFRLDGESVIRVGKNGPWE